MTVTMRADAHRTDPGWTLEPPEDWTELALCSQIDPELFYPDKGGDTKPAKRICADCEVRAECLAYALQHGERFGVWGGLSERERRRLVPRRRPGRVARCGTESGAQAHRRRGEAPCKACLEAARQAGVIRREGRAS
jgi:WhiB family redox-sensing transcriptional regulator